MVLKLAFLAFISLMIAATGAQARKGVLERADAPKRGDVETAACLAGECADTPAQGASSEEGQSPGDESVEVTFWNSIANSKDPADFKAYLEQYPDGSFVRLAKNRLAVLEPQGNSALSAIAPPETDIEVTHWWFDPAESAAVKVLADSFNALGGGKWIDSGMAGYETARPVIVSRILGGDPPGATLLNPGKDAEDLIQAGLMQDLSEIAEQEHWRQLIRPASALAPCLKDGRVWCVPVNLHSGQWMWTNRKVFTDAGLPQPQTFSDVVAAAPTLRARGIKPIAVASGWATTLMLRNIAVGVGGLDLWRSIYARRNVGAAEGQAMRRVFEVIDAARGVVEPGDIFPQWNDAVEEVIRGRAAAVVMGDWAQAEFQAAGQVAGQDYDCLPGLGFKPALELASDYFFFPKQSDEKVTRTQMKLASLLVSKPVQIAFNVRKGSLPVRSDLDSQAVHSCMKKGLDVIDDPRNLFSSFTEAKLDWATLNEIDDLGLEFFNDHGMTAAEAQDRFVDIIKNASEQ